MTPALAVIDELRVRGGWEIHFIGRRFASERERTLSVEARVVPRKGVWFYPISAGRWPRYLKWFSLISMFKIPIGFFQALYYLLMIRPQVILSFGGYVSVPVVLAGWLLRQPVMTHEQTTVKGI